MHLLCLGALATEAQTVVDRTRGANRIITVDGCPLNCARKIVEAAGFVPDRVINLVGGEVAKADRLTASAWSVDEGRVVTIDVDRSPFSGTTLLLFRCLAASLFALLQKLGLCPLDVKTLEHLTEPSMLCGLEEWMSSYHSGEV